MGLTTVNTRCPHLCSKWTFVQSQRWHYCACVSRWCGFRVQVLSTEEKPFQAPEPSPFRGDNGGELAPVAHKYRRVALGGEQTLIVRCEVRRLASASPALRCVHRLYSAIGLGSGLSSSLGLNKTVLCCPMCQMSEDL